MSPERVESNPTTTKRALGYLRWYPSAWRARYGEEFVAHLEIELTQRPVSIARTSDIVAHGLLARLSFQRGLRIALGAAAAAVVVVVMILGALTLSQHFAPVTITSGANGATTGVGAYSAPSQVNDVAFNFSTPSRLSIRITSVKVIPLRGYLAPVVVGAEFAPHASLLANDHGWPIRIPKGNPVQAEGRVPLVQALGATVTLARTDVLWLGLRAPLLRHAYTVEEVQVTYERHGVSHTMTIDQSTSPDVICSSSSRSVNIPSWCSQEMLAAHVIANYTNARQSPAAAAQLVAQLALSEVQGSAHGVPTIAEVRHWATKFFPASGADAIRSVTGVVSAGVPEWRFVIGGASSGSAVVLCTNRGLVDAGGGMIGVGAESCPSPTQS